MARDQGGRRNPAPPQLVRLDAALLRLASRLPDRQGPRQVFRLPLRAVERIDSQDKVIIMVTRRTFVKSAALGAAGLPLLAAPGPSQTSSRKYRVCEIGHDGDYGHMAGAFAEFPNVTMLAVADPVEKARLQHAERVKAPRTYADFREMLQKEKPDIVGIGPNRKTYSTHRLEMIQAAAEVGAHVMVDKPHARSLQEADQIIALAEKHKIKGVVYHPVRIAPAAVRLKKLVDDGLIGDVVEVQVWGVEQLLHMGWHPIY